MAVEHLSTAWIACDRSLDASPPVESGAEAEIAKATRVKTVKIFILSFIYFPAAAS